MILLPHWPRTLPRLPNCCANWSGAPKLRFPANAEHRVAMLKLLINLEEFDFAVCVNSAQDQQVWQCLVDNGAVESLHTVRDTRCLHLEKQKPTMTLNMCLPFVAQMPHLVNLRLTAYECHTDDLEQLVKAAPNLKKLQLQLEDSFEWCKIKGLYTMAALEDVELNGEPGTIMNIIAALMRHMPQLKVNCFRTDKLYPYFMKGFHTHKTKATLTAPLNLEHCSISLSTNVNNISQLGKVKHLMIGDRFYDIYEAISSKDYTTLFKDLCSLNFLQLDFHWKSVPIMKVNGKGITTIVFDAKNENGDVNDCFDLYLVLACCPVLESITVREGILGSENNLGKDFAVPNPEKLLLKKLRMIHTKFIGPKFLSWVLAAPMLEELEIDPDYCMDLKVYDDATLALQNGSLTLKNLHTLSFSIAWLYKPDVEKSALRLAKNMIAFGDKLQNVVLGVHFKLSSLRCLGETPLL